MESYIDKIITPLVNCIGVGAIGLVGYVYKIKRDKRKHREAGVVIINSLLEEVRTGLDIIKNKQYNKLPKKSWEGMKTIPNEVMSIILADSKKIKQESELKFKDIRIHCKNYFEHITENYSQHIANKCTCDCYQTDTEKVKKMLEQTLSLLEKNSKK